MSIKSAVLTDLHAHNYSKFSVLENNRLENCLKVLDLTFRLAHKECCHEILFPGDLYDQQKAIPTEVVNAVISRLKKLFNKYPLIKMIAVSGNHDQATKSLFAAPAISALTHLAEVFEGRFILIDNTFYVMDCGVTVWGIPYYEYREDFEKALEVLAEQAKGHTEAKILLMHQTPSGIIDDSFPYECNVNNPLLRVFDAVYDGHIHQHQRVNDFFTVVGTPLHRDLGDEGSEKGILLIHDLFTPASFEFITTRGIFPEFIRIKAGAVVSEEHVKNYVIVEPDMHEGELKEKAKVEEFNTGLSSKDLLTNYWKEVDGEDKKLLTTGLSLLTQ